MDLLNYDSSAALNFNPAKHVFSVAVCFFTI